MPLPSLTRVSGLRVALSVTLCLLAACSPTGLASAQTVAADPLLGPATQVRAGADDVLLMRSGPATFARLHGLLDAARSTINLEMYELSNQDLAGALIAAFERGVRVTVIDDPTEPSSSGTEARLRAAGVDVIDYPVRKLMIDHVKLLVVDGSAAVVGGINWGAASPANHDYDALLHGPVVHNLDRVFMRDLLTCGRLVDVPDPIADPAIVVASTLPGTEIRPLALDLIDSAAHSIDLEIFDLTDTTIVHALQSAHQRGVRVHVLLDPSQGTNHPADAALRAFGVDVRWYRSHGELLHAKAVVTDGNSVLFGSANWSGGGFVRNHEIDIEIQSNALIAAQMEAQMTLDWNAAA